MRNFHICIGNCKLEPAKGYHAWDFYRARCSRLLNHIHCCVVALPAKATLRHSVAAQQLRTAGGRGKQAVSRISAGFKELRICHWLVRKDWTQGHMPKDGTHGYGLGVLPPEHPQELEKARPWADDFISCDHPVKSKARKGAKLGREPTETHCLAS